LDIVQKMWGPLGKLFAPPGAPSWLRASFLHLLFYAVWLRRIQHNFILRTIAK